MRIKKSVICAINTSKIVKYETYNQAINSKTYLKFITDLINENKITDKYILMDNVSFHKTKTIKETIEKSNNKLLFIPPYSPEFNPIEELFSCLKTYIRSYLTPLHKNRNIDLIIDRYIKCNKPMINYYIHAYGNIQPC